LFQELAPIISNREVMPGVHLIWVESPNLASSVRPGQFIMVLCDCGTRRLLRRPISVFQTGTKSLAFLFAAVGGGTEWLAQRQGEEKIDLLGPLGNGFSVKPETHNLLLVAGGMGIAPLNFLASRALQGDLKVKLLAGARTACQICPEPLLPEGIDIITATEDGTAGESGLITKLLPEYAGWAEQVFLCGPLPMFKAIANDYLGYFKNKPVQVSLEVRMGCGMGFCYACTIRTRQGLKQVCKDGPIFDINDVVWDELR
jgi:dihydroorotate dehydrogenase electron transfer subunit